MWARKVRTDNRLAPVQDANGYRDTVPGDRQFGAYASRVPLRDDESAEQLPQGQLRLRREQDGGGSMRDIIVTMDGQEVGRLGQGKEDLVSVDAGQHVVQARMDWATSLPLDVDVAVEREAVVSVALPGSAIWRSFITPSRALTARLVSSSGSR